MTEQKQSIGEMIGVVSHTYSTKNEAGVSVQITTKYDFRKAPLDAVRGWLASDRTIDHQRKLRKMSAEQIKALDHKVVVCDGLRARGVQMTGAERILAEAKVLGITPEEHLRNEIRKLQSK